MSIKLTFNWQTTRLPVLTTVLGLLWMFYGMTTSEWVPWPEVNKLDLVAEGVVPILALIWVYLAPHMSGNPRINDSLFLGFSMIFVGSLQDFLDEFLIQEELIFHLAEAINPVGMLLATVGLYNWVLAYLKSNVLLKRVRDSYKHQSITDNMTELFNSRYLNEFLPREIENAERDGTALSMVLLDIDNFKKHNDSYGHHEGDVVIKRLARVIRDNSRADDLPVRYGGRGIPGDPARCSGTIGPGCGGTHSPGLRGRDLHSQSRRGSQQNGQRGGGHVAGRGGFGRSLPPCRSGSLPRQGNGQEQNRALQQPTGP